MAKNNRSHARARACAFLEKVPLLDAHNDLPYVVRKSAAAGDVAAYDLTREHQETDTDIPRLVAGRLAGQFWAAFVPTDIENPVRFTLEQIALIKRMNSMHADVFHPAFKAADLARARRLGKIASYIAVESGVGLRNSLELLPLWHELGVRYLTLCHNETLDWIDSATDAPRHGGMTDLGRKVIAECNRLGILVDLSHTSHQAQRQALDCARAPLAITHANAFALVDHPRNVKDDVLAQLKSNGGIVCATFVPTFSNQATRNWLKGVCDPYGKALHGDLDTLWARHAETAGPCPRATLTQVADHLEYMTGIAGIDHIGIGSDFYGGHVPEGLESVARFPDFIAELMLRGWSEAYLAKICSRNLLRVLRGVEKAAG
ncbi:MAG TPA: dipeptidase [Beijerinckiaceae bacterium]|nr:dipeptidase [Beijerinckiaceae bacterium]